VRHALLFLVAVAACVDAPDESTVSSDVITNPQVGGPWASNGTCATTIQYWVAANAPVPAQVVTYMNNAATNWGCSYAQAWHGAYSTGDDGLGAYKWFRTSATADVGYGTYNDCGVVYWNNETQCAYFLPARDTTCIGTGCSASSRAATSTALVLDRYKQLGYENALGVPISNPVPRSWTNTYYQLFTNGVITYHATYGAHALGGADATDRNLALEWRNRFGAHPTTSGSPPVYPLMQDAACTARVLGSTSCIATYRLGRFTKYRDLYVNETSWLIARDGWPRGFIVDGPNATAWVADAQTRTGYGTTPWSGGIGFPFEDNAQVGTTADGYPVYNQQFEWGNIIRQPTNCSSGAAVSTVTFANRSAMTIGATTSGFCPGAAIGPICNQDEQPWIPFTAPGGAAGQYRFRCSPNFSELPLGVEIQSPPGAASIFVIDPVFRDWRDGRKVEDAIAQDGLPTANEACTTTNSWCQQIFGEAAIYREFGADETFRVAGSYFDKHMELGGTESCLGLPTADTPRPGQPRIQPFTGGSIIESTDGVAFASCATQLYDIYCWFPEVRGAVTDNIHERFPGGDTAFFYFNRHGEDEKAGRIPGFLGLTTTPNGGKVLYDTNVWASNFQGPQAVLGQFGERVKWEFFHGSGGGVSTRVYPLIFGQKCVSVPQSSNGTTTPPTPGFKNSKIREDDECWGCDDDVGYVRWDYAGLCDAAWQVSDTGWSDVIHNTRDNGGASGSFVSFDYRQFCYRCRNQTSSTAPCTTGVDPSWSR